MKILPKNLIVSALVASSLVLAGCGPPQSASPPLPSRLPTPSGDQVDSRLAIEDTVHSEGTLEVRVRDHEAAIDQFLSLDVTVESVAIHPAGETDDAWRGLPTEAKILDLTRLLGGPYEVVFSGPVPEGPYDRIRLDILGIRGQLKDGSEAAIARGRFDAYLAFDLSAEQETIAVLDLVVLDVSEHDTGGFLLTLGDASLVWE